MTARAVGYSPLFLHHGDRTLFLLGLRDVVARARWSCLSYCLMTTHYHLLVTTPQANLALGMQRLNGRYAESFNTRHRGRGHVFGGRYKSEPILREAHLLETLRYIALNPVRERMVARPERWRWSAHAHILDDAAAPGWLASSDVLSLFGGTGPAARARYARFVAEGLAYRP